MHTVFAELPEHPSFRTATVDFCAVCCRRLEDVKLENNGMSQALSSKEASVQSLQQQLEEKTRECSVLSRQLQQTLDDAQRQVWNFIQQSLLSPVCQCPQTLRICPSFFFTSKLRVFFSVLSKPWKWAFLTIGSCKGVALWSELECCGSEN